MCVCDWGIIHHINNFLRMLKEVFMYLEQCVDMKYGTFGGIYHLT